MPLLLVWIWRTGPAAINRSAFNDKESEAPAVPSILWLYTDGTKLGQTSLEEGSIRIFLVCKPRERNLVVFKLWNTTTQAWQDINERLHLDSGDVLGSAADMVRLTLDAKPLVKGLVLSRDSMRLIVAPELLSTHKVQRSTDLIHWEDYPMSGEEGETGLTIDPDQSHEFYRLIRR